MVYDGVGEVVPVRPGSFFKDRRELLEGFEQRTVI